MTRILFSLKSKFLSIIIFEWIWVGVKNPRKKYENFRVGVKNSRKKYENFEVGVKKF